MARLTYAEKQKYRWQIRKLDLTALVFAAVSTILFPQILLLSLIGLLIFDRAVTTYYSIKYKYAFFTNIIAEKYRAKHYVRIMIFESIPLFFISAFFVFLAVFLMFPEQTVHILNLYGLFFGVLIFICFLFMIGHVIWQIEHRR